MSVRFFCVIFYDSPFFISLDDLKREIMLVICLLEMFF